MSLWISLSFTESLDFFIIYWVFGFLHKLTACGENSVERALYVVANEEEVEQFLLVKREIRDSRAESAARSWR